MLVLIDGQPADSVPVTDRGLLYGDGLFETVLLRHGHLAYPELHLQRLMLGCERLDIALAREDLAHQLDVFLELLAEQSVRDTVVKIIVTRGDGGRGYMPPLRSVPRIILQSHPLPSDIETNYLNGIDCTVCTYLLPHNPQLAGLKHLNRLDQIMGSQELYKAAIVNPDIREALMSDHDGHLIEGTRSNVFVVINGRLCTPDLQGCGVDGVIRQALIGFAGTRSWPLDIRKIKLHELGGATEMFICNSVIGVWPVNQLHMAEQVISLTGDYYTRLCHDFLNAGLSDHALE